MNPLQTLTALVKALDGMEKAEEEYDRALNLDDFKGFKESPGKEHVAWDAARAVFDNALINARRLTGVYP